MKKGARMSETLNVVTLLGSLRKCSFNGMVARTLPKVAPAGMTVSPLPSIGDIPLYDADIQQEEGFPASVEALAEQIRNADGVVIVTPEYNYSVPGGLKMPSTGYPVCLSNRWRVSPFLSRPVQWGRLAARAASIICARFWCSLMRW